MCDFVLSGSEPLGTQSPHSRSLLGPPSARGGLRPPPATGNCPENHWICEWAAPPTSKNVVGAFSLDSPHSLIQHSKMCAAQSLKCVQLLATYGLSLPGSSVHGDSPGKNTGVGVMPSSRGSSQLRNRTRVSNPGLLHCKRILYCLSHQGSPVAIWRYTGRASTGGHTTATCEDAGLDRQRDGSSPPSSRVLST